MRSPDCLRENVVGRGGRQILLDIVREMAHPEPGYVVAGGCQILADR